MEKCDFDVGYWVQQQFSVKTRLNFTCLSNYF